MPPDSPQINFTPGSSYDIDFLADLYTQTFADYFYPCVVTTEDLTEWIRVEHLDLDRCPVMLVDDQPVGFATVGIRGEESYCKGFGVIVPHRGKGLSHALCGEMIRQARHAGTKRMTLGVIKANTRAVQAYQRAGFQPRRELVSIEWKSESDETAAGSANQIIETSAQDLLADFDNLHSVQPIWNRDLPSLRQLKSLQGLAVMSDRSPVAYVLLQAARGAMEIVDFGAHGEDGTTALAALLTHLQQTHPHLVCVNEPADNPYLSTLLAGGFRETIRRLELQASL